MSRMWAWCRQPFKRVFLYRLIERAINIWATGPSRGYKAYLQLSWIISRPLKMMYDFHYPLGRGKLNEDTANCRAKQSGMMGKNVVPRSPFLAFSLLCWKNEALLQFWGRWSASPPLPTSLPAGVHRLSINQELLTARTTLSHHRAISWVADVTQTS